MNIHRQSKSEKKLLCCMFQLKYTFLDEIWQMSLAFDVFISNSQLAIRQLDHEYCRPRLHYINRSLSRTAKVQALVKTFLKFPYEISCPSCSPTANATKTIVYSFKCFSSLWRSSSLQPKKEITTRCFEENERVQPGKEIGTIEYKPKRCCDGLKFNLVLNSSTPALVIKCIRR